MGPLAQGRSFRADNLLNERRKSVRCAHLVPNLAQMSSKAQLLDQPVSKRHFFFRLDPRPTHTASRAVKPPTQPAIADAGNPSDHFKFENQRIRVQVKNTNAGLLLVTSSHDDEERYDQVASADVDALVLLVALPARHYDTGAYDLKS